MDSPEFNLWPPSPATMKRRGSLVGSLAAHKGNPVPPRRSAERLVQCAAPNTILRSFLQITRVEKPMFQVTRQIDFCYGHRLLNYEGKCRHLHGHNGRAEITIESEKLDKLGMVLDFSDIKKVVSQWIDEELDHRMILHQDDPVLPILQGMGEPLHIINDNPTAENIAKLIYDFTAKSGFPVTEVRLWETPKCYATYVGAKK
jgi:6-pyruvoyltetrahydropterin/6-carboxytetrahydropterin synthase